MKPLGRKVLLLLLTGAALSIAYTPRQYWRTVKIAGKEWKKINKEEIRKEIRQLYRSKLLKKTENKDGSITMILTDKGKLRALTYKFDEMKIEDKKWDGKWRVVGFDVPEKIRWGRDALRDKIKKLGFYEFQKSVFIYPYDCKNEIDFIIEFFGIRKYVRFGILEYIDNEKHFKKIFKLI
ncbi:MAG: Repressor in ring oxydation complex/ phenylacetic acid degradation pathway related protein (PaaX) [Parcubacteria group bacterium GW2011_GWA2_37_10]|nr:MAG: Repressor in ring oxydation complex/ phenylacetic acid degradation pathway related protein (PaaX) [Parcubacteria group bacterium GW2011_GWA2_37_10]